MSVARPIISTDALTAESGRLPVMGQDRFVHLKLEHGWTARVIVTEPRTEGRPGKGSAVLTAQHWRKWLRNPLDWTRQPAKQDLLKTSGTTTVCRIRLPLEEGRHVEAVCKRSRSRYLRKRLLNLFRTSRPTRTWRRARILLENEIPTARPLAVLERRQFGLLRDSMLITEYLHNTVDLETLLTVRMRELDSRRSYQLKAKLTDLLTEFLLRLEAASIYHRDLKALNVIVQWDWDSDDPPRICLVDLDGIKRNWFYGRNSWMRMLMRLNVSVDGFRRVSLTDRARLLRRYLEAQGRTKAWKQAWRELAILSDRKREVRARQQERSFQKYGRF